MPRPLDHGSRFGHAVLMLDDLRLDAIAVATRQRDGDAAVALTGLMLAEEVGEAIQQLRRLLSYARQPARPDEVGAELADVVIAAAVVARLVGVDVSQHIDQKLGEGVR